VADAATIAHLVPHYVSEYLITATFQHFVTIFEAFFWFFRQSRAVVLEKVDMRSSHGEYLPTPEEEDACPPAYCITPSVSLATTIGANNSTEGK
jgi:hypothetical protein